LCSLDSCGSIVLGFVYEGFLDLWAFSLFFENSELFIKAAFEGAMPKNIRSYEIFIFLKKQYICSGILEGDFFG
jgi:hypothetical protein